MFLLRRAAIRSFSSTTTAFVSKPRTLATKTPTSLRSQQWKISSFQRRFASDEATPAQATTTDETVPTQPSKAEQDIKAEVDSAKDTAADKVEDVKEKAEDVKEKTEEVKEKTQEAVEDVADSTRVNASEAASSVAETAQNVSQTIKETAASAANAANDLTRNAATAIMGESARAPRASRDSNAGRSDEPKPSKILYIGNLFFEVNASQLESRFAKYGNIANCRIANDPQGLSRGFGYVEFETVEEATAAKDALNQTSFEGRRMAVQYHIRRDTRTNPGSPSQANRTVNPPAKSLFIGNMSFQMSDKDLNDAFRDIRNVLDIRVAIDRRSGQPRGFAHADFIDIASAEEAKKQLENKTIFGRQLRVDFSKDVTDRERGFRGGDRGGRAERSDRGGERRERREPREGGYRGDRGDRDGGERSERY